VIPAAGAAAQGYFRTIIVSGADAAPAVLAGSALQAGGFRAGTARTPRHSAAAGILPA